MNYQSPKTWFASWAGQNMHRGHCVELIEIFQDLAAQKEPWWRRPIPFLAKWEPQVPLKTALRFAQLAQQYPVIEKQRPDFDTLEHQFIKWVMRRARKDPQFAEVTDAYPWAKRHHNGKRDNGEPEFIHQVRMALQVTDLIDRLEAKGHYLPEACSLMKAILCHDLREDKARDIETGESMNHARLSHRIGERSAIIVYNMSRKYYDPAGQLVRKGKEEEHRDLLNDPAALLGKLIDRDDNLGSMMEFTKDGVPTGVIYTPDKAKEKMYEAIQVLMQAARPERVMKEYGPEWVEPLRLASEDLRDTIEDVMTDIIRSEIRRNIFDPQTYAVSKRIEAQAFPNATVERASKKGKPSSPPPDFEPGANAPESRPLGRPGMSNQMS